MKTIKQPLGPFRTVAKMFSTGAERDVEITLYPEYVEVRLMGSRERFHVGYGTIYRVGVDAEVVHRIKRGVV